MPVEATVRSVEARPEQKVETRNTRVVLVGTSPLWVESDTPRRLFPGAAEVHEGTREKNVQVRV